MVVEDVRRIFVMTFAKFEELVTEKYTNVRVFKHGEFAGG